ncbi:Fpg/Nei family DNA glycosylase [Marinicrinis lubricantis]|uniref:Formamidopyrimidine-DNA glycosylase n=1 Tax=Marinicrinis lubricantis TaxID=2086470 RepID=A0ABW1ITD8_9BACL
MPELPEMETYLRLLTPRVTGRPITDTIIEREKSINVPVQQWTRDVVQQTIVKLERRGKTLLFHLQSGKCLLLHLMLGGWMFYGTEKERPNRTVQVQLSFGDQHLYFIGLRLGYLHLHSASAAEEKSAALGIDPFSPQLTAERFYELLRRKRKTMKAFMLDQSLLSGIGNCYSDEICFEAGMHPQFKTENCSQGDAEKLLYMMRSVLREAILSGGYMDEPMFVGDTLTGGYSENLRVHDRADQPCHRCGTNIIMKEIASRKAYFCPNCQSKKLSNRAAAGIREEEQ